MVASTTPTSGAGATRCQDAWSTAAVSGPLRRSRGPFTEGKNITGAPTIEAAKAACERHAEQRTDIP